MKTEDMTAEALKGKTADELKALLVDLRKEQFNLRFQKTGGQLSDTAQVRKARRAIARVKTFLAAVGRAAPAPKAKAGKGKAKATKAA